jgi:hypothetical protein
MVVSASDGRNDGSSRSDERAPGDVKPAQMSRSIPLVLQGSIPGSARNVRSPARQTMRAIGFFEKLELVVGFKLRNHQIRWAFEAVFILKSWPTN